MREFPSIFWQQCTSALQQPQYSPLPAELQQEPLSWQHAMTAATAADTLLSCRTVWQVDTVARSHQMLAMPMLRSTLAWKRRLQESPPAQPLLQLLDQCAQRLLQHYTSALKDKLDTIARSDRSQAAQTSPSPFRFTRLQAPSAAGVLLSRPNSLIHRLPTEGPTEGTN